MIGCVMGCLADRVYLRTDQLGMHRRDETVRRVAVRYLVLSVRGQQHCRCKQMNQIRG